MKCLFPIICLLITVSTYCQQTVGVFLNDPKAYNGYTLFGNNQTTYLIDNCGRIVNTWTSDYKPGLSMYLLENGQLLRTGRKSGSFNGGGLGGVFELFSWDGGLLWSYAYASNESHAHHDIEVLPNGNFLMIAWEKKSASESTAVGRKVASEVWSERIVELRMEGSNQATVVWQWSLWDHLVQNEDQSKPNFAEPKDRVGRVDINYTPMGPEERDWIHLNAIDYNPELDQIALSSRNFNEVWIIDHSTTTAQASGESGGLSGKGGSILYRFGNPAAYGRGAQIDQLFYGQHDVRWIDPGLPNAGRFMVFNNEFDNRQSAVHIWKPPLNNDEYTLEDNQPFGPDGFEWTYTHPDFYSEIMSGASVLPNGNTFICEGETGRLFELTPKNEVVWEYINPVNKNGFPVSQGGTVHFNELFRATRYGANNPIFDGRDLTPANPVETNPWPLNCEIFEGTVGVTASAYDHDFVFVEHTLGNDLLSVNAKKRCTCTLVDISGRVIREYNPTTGLNKLDMTGAKSGLYFFHCMDEKNRMKIFKIFRG